MLSTESRQRGGSLATRNQFGVPLACSFSLFPLSLCSRWSIVKAREADLTFWFFPPFPSYPDIKKKLQPRIFRFSTPLSSVIYRPRFSRLLKLFFWSSSPPPHPAIRCHSLFSRLGTKKEDKRKQAIEWVEFLRKGKFKKERWIEVLNAMKR